MSILEQYPKTHRNETEKLRAVLARAPGVEQREREELALAINDMADKACDLNDIFDRLLQPVSPEELADLLAAFELTVEQIRGGSDTIDGKLYEIGDRLRTNTLPGQRGRYLLWLGEPIIPDGPRWVHFSWVGDTFCIRDYLGGKEWRQQPGVTALDVWRAASQRRRATGLYHVPVKDVQRWRELLAALGSERTSA